MIIVVGIDDTGHSTLVLEHAIEEARLRGAELHVVHVFHLPATVTSGYGIFPVDVDRLATAERQRVWGLVEGHLERGNVPIERVDLEGYPPDALVAYVKNVKAGLLIVGTRGRGELASMVLGSTSHRAIHLSPCDVLVVKPTPAGD